MILERGVGKANMSFEIGKSTVLTSDGTYGGVLKQKTPNGCVDWRIWSTSGENMGPS